MRPTAPLVISLLFGLEASARTWKGGFLNRRTTSDVCANLVAQPLRVNIIPGKPPVLIGSISKSASICVCNHRSESVSDGCLCYSGVGSFCSTNLVCRAAANVVGVDGAIAGVRTTVRQNRYETLCMTLKFDHTKDRQ